MTAATFVLNRHRDISGVSGVGVVAEGIEFSDGAVAIRWLGKTPSTSAWGDIRHVEAIHGHQGATDIAFNEPDRLIAAYQRVTPFLLSARYHDRPNKVEPHPDHPDRLRCTFLDERTWRFWVALLDGSTHAATHAEVNGEIATTWITPDGNVWLQYFTPGTFTDLLEGESYDTPGLSWESHDDPEVTK